jgi:hypothetical protein
MHRRPAIAAASAISIGFLSGVVALGAHLGALGFTGSPTRPTSTPTAASTASARVTDQRVPTVAQHDEEHVRDAGERHGDEERVRDSSPSSITREGTTIGADDD